MTIDARLPVYRPTPAPIDPLDANSFAIPPRLADTIAERWLEWLPLCRIAIQHDVLPAAALETLRTEHRCLVLMLRRVHSITMRQIRRLNMDDPRPASRAFRQADLARYLERRSRTKKRPNKLLRSIADNANL